MKYTSFKNEFINVFYSSRTIFIFFSILLFLEYLFLPLIRSLIFSTFPDPFSSYISPPHFSYYTSICLLLPICFTTLSQSFSSFLHLSPPISFLLLFILFLLLFSLFAFLFPFLLLFFSHQTN